MPRWTTILLLVCIVEPTTLATGIAAQERVAIAEPAVPVAARDLPRGTVLEAADIATDPAGGAAEGKIVGWVTRRVVGEGEPLRPPTIAPPLVVKSGDTVQLVWRDGSLEILLTGRAMNSAAAGEKVMVRVDLKRRFEGLAESPGVVRLASHDTNRR